MADNLKKDWKETGKQLGGAFKSLGKTLFSTGKLVVEKVDEALNEEQTTENKDEE